MIRPVIGIDARYAFREERHGIGEYIYYLLEAYAEQADDLTFHLYLDAQAGAVPLSLSGEQFRVTRLPVSNPLLFEEWGLPRAASRDKVALLHLTANYGASCATCPTVHTINDLIEFIRPDVAPWRRDWRHGVGRWIRRQALPRAIRRTHAIICPSDCTKRDVLRLMPCGPGKISVIPYAVSGIHPSPDPAQLRRTMRSRGLLVPDTYVLVFGALDPRKNPEVVVRVFSRLESDFQGVELWLVGVEDLDRFTGTAPTSCIRVLPFLPRSDVLDLLCGASALVYPSLYEGFGLPVLEAMSAGVPVLASNRSSVPEVVGDAGILFDPVTGEGLEDGLRLILGHPEAAHTLRAKGLDRATEFTWERVGRAHLEVYRRVLEELRA